MSEEEPISELPEEIIKHVGFTITTIDEGKCCRCKETGPMIRVTALIYYAAAVVGKPGAEIESLWSVDYCQYCIKDLTKRDARKEEEIDKMYV